MCMKKMTFWIDLKRLKATARNEFNNKMVLYRFDLFFATFLKSVSS